MATNFSPCKGSYVLNQFPSNVMFGMNGFHVSASGAIQGHHGPLVFHMIPLGQNWPCLRGGGSQVGTQEQRTKVSKFFFETWRPRALMFDI